MKKISKLLVIPFGVLVFSSVSPASMLDQVIYNVIGQASNAAGARLGDEIYYGSSRKSSSHRKVRRKHRKKRHVAPPAPVMTNEKRIQQALTSLGFYHGKIDGQINSFETRTAVKNMNMAYGISNDSSLRQEVRDSLTYLGTLFKFDRYLIAGNTSSKAKNKKIQVALKIHGYYHSGIDGAIGRGSRNAIREYQMSVGLATTGSLDYEAEYQLISSAKEKNDRNLNDTINSLKSFGANRPVQQGYQQPTQQRYQQPVQGYQQPMQQRQQGYQQQVPIQEQRYQAPQSQQQGYQQNAQPIVVQQARQGQVNTAVQQPATQTVTNQVTPQVTQATTNTASTSLPDASTIEMYTDSKK